VRLQSGRGPRVAMRILTVLAMAASIVGAGYTVASFYASPPPNAQPAAANPAGSAGAPSAEPAPGAGGYIDQRSSGDNSPNVIGGGNVTIFSR